MSGQLGHGDQENQLAPRRVPAAGFNGERVVMVAAGDTHTVALSEEGHVFAWGEGQVFIWGDGEAGQLWLPAWHDDLDIQWAPRQVEAGRFGGEKVVFVAAGGLCTVAVTAGGRAYTWGYGHYGQLGRGDGHGDTDDGDTDDRLVPTVVGAGAFGCAKRSASA
jgi:alpha-tubulin suppressor-like RCC1 family protein